MSVLERLQYGFDRDSRRTWRRRVLATGEDDKYGYDGLGQVVEDARGNLNLDQAAISAVPVSQQNWDYDPTGNWRGYETRTNGTVALAQHRVHDKGNRLTQVGGSPSPVLLDRAGRMLELPPGASGDWDESLKLKWDAWGRITEVKRGSDDEVLGAYAYDGQTRRVTREVGGEVQHSYYSDSWRPVEERPADAGKTAQYLWGARHRDDLARRDRFNSESGELEDTRYVLMDYYSPAAIVDEEGEVTERYAFSAFGIRGVLQPDFAPRSVSECGFEFAFQGQFVDGESGLLNYGYRYYSPQLGRFMCKDPIAEDGGNNLYAFVDNRPVNAVDHLGLLGDCCEADKKPDFFNVRCCPDEMRKDKLGRDRCKVAKAEDGEPGGTFSILPRNNKKEKCCTITIVVEPDKDNPHFAHAAISADGDLYDYGPKDLADLETFSGGPGGRFFSGARDTLQGWNDLVREENRNKKKKRVMNEYTIDVPVKRSGNSGTSC